MKGKAVVLVLAGVGAMSGMTLSAGATEDLWSYELAADGAGDQVYQFRDVELTIPADWDGKYVLPPWRFVPDWRLMRMQISHMERYLFIIRHHRKHFQQSMVRKIPVDICLH